eukprot:Unigene1753_Nuclearia_a/m.5421 Unigene1753_Nuclearia_a/g.5421  ORF Unigene1753_Nuclearia_a/g.5421 Unigene1753_Nuclearia_a/m.5421 type:complete len:321 (-) Unigene1753_Nuclearia_a:323-1285(-)
MCPASSRLKSSSELTSLSRLAELRWTMARRWRWRCVSGSTTSLSSCSSGPRMSVSGVRNSCETLEKNAVLARSSSASILVRRRFSSFAAVWIGVAMCDVISSTCMRYESSNGRRGLSPTMTTPCAGSSFDTASAVTTADVTVSVSTVGNAAQKRSARLSTRTVLYPFCSASCTGHELTAEPSRAISAGAATCDVSRLAHTCRTSRVRSWLKRYTSANGVSALCFSSARPAIAKASSTDAVRYSASRSLSAARRRELTTRSVISIAKPKSPPTVPSSKNSGEHVQSKYVSSGKPLRSSVSGWFANTAVSWLSQTASSRLLV